MKLYNKSRANSIYFISMPVKKEREHYIKLHRKTEIGLKQTLNYLKCLKCYIKADKVSQIKLLSIMRNQTELFAIHFSAIKTNDCTWP